MGPREKSVRTRWFWLSLPLSMAVVTLITPMGLSANPYLAAYGSSLVFALLFGITGQIQNDSRKVGFGQTLLLASPVVLWVAMALIWEMWKWYHHRDW